MNELVKGLSQNDVVTYPHAFCKWVYANPCPSLVGIRRIPAYHVDYTTGYMYVILPSFNRHLTDFYFENIIPHNSISLFEINFFLGNTKLG